jgi:outer membrane protein OmpA-like peptidoglycan-associated protein
VDLSVDLGVGLPVGTGLALAGDAGPRFHARMVVGSTMGWLQPSLEAGVLFRPSVLLTSTEQAARAGATSEIRLGAALATTGQGLRGELGLRTTLVPQESVSPQVSMELLGGVRFPLLPEVDGFVLGGPGVGGAPGTPLFRVLAGITFGREPPPRMTIIDPALAEGVKLIQEKPTPPSEDKPVAPTRIHEYIIVRDDPRETSADGTSREQPRPHQPGPQEQLVLRGEIHFAQGSSELPGVVPLLDQAVLRLSELARGGTIVVEGHADTEGTDSSNMTMSLQRAQAVRRYLIAQGIPAARVRIRGFSSNWPVSARPATEQERQLNRRAEVLVLTENPAPPVTTQAPAP